METPGRRWGCSRVKVLLIPSASHLHGSHASPDAQPCSGGVWTPSSHLLQVQAAMGSLGGAMWASHCCSSLGLVVGPGGRREASKALPGSPVTKSRTGVCGSLWLYPLAIWSFSSSSGFSLGSVALLPSRGRGRPCQRLEVGPWR